MARRSVVTATTLTNASTAEVALSGKAGRVPLVRGCYATNLVSAYCGDSGGGLTCESLYDDCNLGGASRSHSLR
jgi:hypothetical protein